ncbi:MAG: SH3 domain-containing protein [Anaerolineae bacterium]|nr:SH3 domain-containing protein [Anaerolineae bacterium]
MPRHGWPFLLALLSLVAMSFWPGNAPHTFAQSAPAPEVYAEAVGQANLRAGPGVEYAQVGAIASGVRYRVLARHVYVPWLRLDVPGIAEAWVFADLVTVTGRLADVPTVSAFPPLDTPLATPTPAPGAPAGDALPSSTPTPTPTLSGPLATTRGEANLRFGPDLQYPVIVRVPAGASLRVIERHALVPWLRVALPESPTGSGWVYHDIVEISGDLSQVPVTEAEVFSYPTLTPTPQTVVVGGAPWDGAPAAAGRLANTLGMAMHEYLLAQGFAPTGDRIASVFLLDLRTGDTFTLNGGVAFSGMSLTKIPVLVTYFQSHDGPLSRDDAFLVADTMMCSENLTTNALLAQIGGGDALRGARRVTATMQQLGLSGTFILRPYTIREGEPAIEAGTITTGADQVRTLPDPTNQIVPADLGWLLASIYQCAQGEGGLLLERFPDSFTVQECRQMLTALDANAVGVFLEAGVPPGARVLHKHGWIGDTHGDAGLVIGPESAYLLVVALYGRDWLEFELSAPIIGELSRLAWNALNPSAPVAEVASRVVPAECDPWADPVMAALLAPSLPGIE